MSCQQCNHTMQKICGQRVFWCPRCGSIKDCDQRAYAGLPDESKEGDNELGFSTPWLMGHVRHLRQTIVNLCDEMHSPGDRDPRHVWTLQEAMIASLRNVEEAMGSHD